MSEQLAEKFHDTYERLATEYGWKTQGDCRVSFADLPKENRELLIATVCEVCANLLKDSKRLEDLELALEEGDICMVTASDMVEADRYRCIEIQFDSDREPVTRESLADAIDEAMEEPEL